jgi:hypothetical protein
MSNIGEVIGWKFNHQAGMSTAEGVITAFPNGIPSAEDQATWTTEYKGYKVMADIRGTRDQLLTATDWWGASDNTMSDAQKAYRLALRNFPATVDISNIVWPTKP